MTIRIRKHMNRRLIQRLPRAIAASRHDKLRAAIGGALSFGAVAVGAVAIGAIAVGALAIGRLVIGRARIRRLEIDELVVGRLRVVEELQGPVKSTPT